MKKSLAISFLYLCVVSACQNATQPIKGTEAEQSTVVTLTNQPEEKKLFMDVHYLEPGKVTAEAVAEAHEKDLAVQGSYGVNFMKYWVDEEKGVVMCLSEAQNAEAITKAHEAAHGLVPDEVLSVQQGE